MPLSNRLFLRESGPLLFDSVWIFILGEIRRMLNFLLAHTTEEGENILNWLVLSNQSTD